MSETITESRFWKPLWKHYSNVPSIALCRVPELEYASTLKVEGRTLDHCCGDGLFAAIGWPHAKFTDGCDINADSIQTAEKQQRHERLAVCDAAAHLPYERGVFELVFNNSALEHIPDLDASLREVARVTRRGGSFAFNVLNHRFFEWWPQNQESLQGYREWQPFYHALNLQEWIKRLSAVGFEVQQVQGYFNEEASKALALLDCEFSGYFIKQRPSKLVSDYQSFFGLSKASWRKRLGQLKWCTEADAGAGYFIIAQRQ